LEADTVMQALVVALLVTGCFVYAAWALMPRAARKALAVRLLARPLPASMAAFLRRHAADATGCACDGCDAGAPAAKATTVEKPITFHPRRRT
jgi:hypothetical protein